MAVIEALHDRNYRNRHGETRRIQMEREELAWEPIQDGAFQSARRTPIDYSRPGPICTKVVLIRRRGRGTVRMVRSPIHATRQQPSTPDGR